MKQFARDYSDDPSAKTNDGDLGWFADGKMVYNFNEAVINNKIGSIVLAESPFGFHIIKVEDKKEPVKKVRVATVVLEVVPSNETYQQTFAKASKLASENHTLADFDIAVEDERLNKRTVPNVKKMDYRIPGLNNPRQIIRWAFNENTETGQVSEVFDLDGQFVVAVVTKAGEEGYPSLEDVKTRLDPFVYNKLKGEMLKKEMSGKSMNELTSESGYAKEELSTLNFTSRNLKGYGKENEVIGSFFGMSEGTVYGLVIFWFSFGKPVIKTGCRKNSVKSDGL
jgi:parvulin-like peptidyl-prolyl isomerase